MKRGCSIPSMSQCKRTPRLRKIVATFADKSYCSLDDRSPGPTLDYDPDIDNYMSNYHWNTKFDVDSFDVVLCARNIDSHNNSLWDKVKVAICDKLGIDPPVTSGCKFASTTDIERRSAEPGHRRQLLYSTHPPRSIWS